LSLKGYFKFFELRISNGTFAIHEITNWLLFSEYNTSVLTDLPINQSISNFNVLTALIRAHIGKSFSTCIYFPQWTAVGKEWMLLQSKRDFNNDDSIYRVCRKIPAYFVHVQITNSFGGWPWLVKFSFQNLSFPWRFPINISRALIYSSFYKKLLFNKCTDSLWLTQNCLHLYSEDWYIRFLQNLAKCHHNTRHRIPEDHNLNCLLYFSFSDI
jgi:hypothetical protein